MFNSSNEMSPADYMAMSGNNSLGGNSGWWIILLILLFAGWNGGGFGTMGTRTPSTTNSGISDGYILTSDFASLERQMESGFDGIRQQGTAIANGISSLGYDQLGQMNNINTNINSATNSLGAQINALGNQMSSCCCENRYQSATQAADLNYNLATQSCQTRQAVTDSTATILNAIKDMQTSALQDKISELTAANSELKFAASQQAQNAYLLNALAPTYSRCACGN